MFAIKISEAGRLVVPVEVRRALNLTEGETLLGEMRDGEFVLTTRKARLERARAAFRKCFPPEPGRSVVDEFIAERRAEAERDGRARG